MTVWYEHGPEVDVVMDLKNLTFAPGSVEAIYSFHVLDHLFASEIAGVLKNWKACLKQNGVLFVVVDDFEFISRAFVGGDISIDQFNESFSHPAYLTRDNLLSYCLQAGFKEDGPKIWFDHVGDLFPKMDYELIFEIPNV